MPSALVPKKWKAGTLHSGSKKGPIVKKRSQMIAIMLSERRKEQQTGSADNRAASMRAIAAHRAKGGRK